MNDKNKISRIRQYQIHEIQTQALLLLDEVPFQKITMSLLASKLSFTRANLYKYFESIEAVFMGASIEILHDFYKKVVQIEVIDVDHFIKKFSTIVSEETTLWKISGIMDNILEMNVNFDSLVSYERQFNLFYDQLFIEFKKHFLDLSDMDVLKIYHFFYLITPTMYTSLNLSERKKQAMKILNREPFEMPMYYMYENFFQTFVKGIYQSKK